jgi:glycosyltransferase involved in cell wall biosynthesis
MLVTRRGAMRRRPRARGRTARAVPSAPASRAAAAGTEARLEVLFLTSATLPPLGADTWVSVQLMRELDRDTHRVHVACATGPSSHPTPTFLAVGDVGALHLLPVDLGPELIGEPSLEDRLRALWATLPALGSLVRLAWYIRRHDIRVIHSTDRPRDAFACTLLARMTRARSIVHVHVGYAEWMSGLRRRCIRNADALIAISQFVKGTLAASGHPDHTTHVVLNAIDLDRWVPGVGRDEAREELGVPAAAPVVVTVCRLFEAKGPEQLIRALAVVRDEVPDVRLLIVGDDGPEQGRYARHLADVAAGLGLADQVLFLGRRSDVPRLMAAADVFAMPSVDEPFGLVYLEAMAMERPVVALANGGTPEVVVDGVTGLLSEPGDMDALVANLERLLRDPSLRRQMGQHGRRRVEEHFTADRMAADAAEVYRLVAS